MSETVTNFRNVALVGPYLSGKTTLLESILSVTAATSRKGTAKDTNRVGDSSPEAKELRISKRTLAIISETLLIRIKSSHIVDPSLSISTGSNPLSLYNQILKDARRNRSFFKIAVFPIPHSPISRQGLSINLWESMVTVTLRYL